MWRNLLGFNLTPWRLTYSFFRFVSRPLQGILRHIDPEIPILIHSMNHTAARRMSTTLMTAGFDVSVVPMADLTEDRFLVWIETVWEIQKSLAPE